MPVLVVCLSGVGCFRWRYEKKCFYFFLFFFLITIFHSTPVEFSALVDKSKWWWCCGGQLVVLRCLLHNTGSLYFGIICLHLSFSSAYFWGQRVEFQRWWHVVAVEVKVVGYGISISSIWFWTRVVVSICKFSFHALSSSYLIYCFGLSPSRVSFRLCSSPVKAVRAIRFMS